MQGDINRSSQLSSVDSVNVDFASVCSDQNVIFAWMNVETSDASLPDEVLKKLGLRHSTVSNVNKLHSNAVGCRDSKYAKLSSHLLALDNRIPISGCEAAAIFFQYDGLLLVHTSKSGAVLNDANPIETRLYIICADEARIVGYNGNLLIFRHEKVTNLLLLSLLKCKCCH